MFSFSGKKRASETTMLVSTVTGHGACAAVVRIYRSKGSVTVPVVLFSCESKIPLRDTAAPDLHAQSACAALADALSRCRSFSGSYDRLVCTVGEPWIESHSRTSHLEKGEPFQVTGKLIDDLILRESRMFEIEVIRDHSLGEEVGIVGISDTVVDINGYRTPQYAGAKAKTVDVHMSFSLAPAGFVESLIGVFADVFHRTDVFVSSADTARTLLVPEGLKASVLALGGTTSSLSVIDRGHASYHSGMPDGLSSLEANLSSLFGVDRNRIPSIMAFASDENVLQHHRDVYYRRIEAGYRDLGANLRRGFLELARHVEKVPEPVFLVSDQEWAGVLAPMISKDAGVDVRALSADAMEGRVAFSHEAPVRHLSLAAAIVQAARNASS